MRVNIYVVTFFFKSGCFIANYQLQILILSFRQTYLCKKGTRMHVAEVIKCLDGIISILPQASAADFS